MKVLNLYAGLGGNRKLWEQWGVTAIEMNEQVSEVYLRIFPTDILLRCDAHEYLLSNAQDFDFIWSSPPCQSHSKMAKATRHKSRRYPDLKLYEEIIFLQNFFKGLWVVENVVPYYEPLIKPSFQIGRHIFWANFPVPPMENPPEPPKDFINQCNLAGKKALQNWLGIHYEENIYYGNNHCPAQILRNCVHPLVGRHIMDAALAHMKGKTA